MRLYFSLSVLYYAGHAALFFTFYIILCILYVYFRLKKYYCKWIKTFLCLLMCSALNHVNMV